MADASPHIRLLPSWFNPSADPNWGMSDEHTFLEANTGTGYSLTVDPTIRLQHGAPIAPGITRIEWHKSHEVDFDMTYMAHMHKPQSATRWKVPKFFADELGPAEGHRDMVELMHSSAVFEEAVTTTQGNVHEVSKYWGSLRGVIDSVLEAMS
jgi:hypothetical protein